MNEKQDSALRSIKRTTMLDSATEALRNAILNGEIEPGERVNEITYTTKLEISRTTFREALRQLEQSGLLVRIPFRGMFVREFDEEEIEELNNLRGVLETYASEIIIKKSNNKKKDLRPLYQIVSQMDGLDPEVDAARTNELHIAFHHTLMDLAGDKLLFTVWNDLAQQFWMAMRVSQLSFIVQRDSDNFAEAHRAVIDALAAGDGEQVRKIMQKHVSHSTDSRVDERSQS